MVEVSKPQAGRPLEENSSATLSSATLSKAGASVQERGARAVGWPILQVLLLRHIIVYKQEFFSDEPGLYIEGEFGIRLETVLRWQISVLSYSSLVRVMEQILITKVS